MKDFVVAHPWKIIEEGYDPDRQKVSESLFSIGNGQFGQRANHEESYSGPSLQGSYLAGIYYPDRTRVGWWKNGYPEYFAKVLNSPSWIDLEISINGVRLDVATCQVDNFRRELDMQKGLLTRSFDVSVGGVKCKIRASRYCHYQHKDVGVIQYQIAVLSDEPASVVVESGIDGDVRNEDANYDELFWEEYQTNIEGAALQLSCRTRKTEFKATLTTTSKVVVDGIEVAGTANHQERKVASSFELETARKSVIDIEKITVIQTTLSHPDFPLPSSGMKRLKEMQTIGMENLLQQHCLAWKTKWQESDILIEGDVKAQQGIRFNIFQLHQTYHGEDPNLNIGPKGFTGEKYGGSTYWDTEAYCLPFFQATAPPQVAENLLKYRHRHLAKAIENAAKLGFSDGAALYPMVTMNGEECHNEWEITFEEIHRNGAIAYAIFDHARYTGDESYRYGPGADVLIAIARFWKQRTHFATRKKAYVIHGVTGPNEYENNVNNNWYTNYMAAWCLKYASSTVRHIFEDQGKRALELQNDQGITLSECNVWEDIANHIFLPEDHELGVFLQQEGFLDKELLPASSIPSEETPIHEHWSWDRILRSCFIKQADVLQGLYFFADQFELDTVRRNFDFYEPMTVHESSLSPCVHSIVASRIDRPEKAYALYLRTARLDLDDYNNDTDDGLHITSMAGSWLAIVKGFAGMQVQDGHLHIAPYCPQQWSSFAFRIRFRDRLLDISISHEEVRCQLEGDPLDIYINGNKCQMTDSLRYAHH